MPRHIIADGRDIIVPDDATADEINQIVGPAPSSAAPHPLAPSPAPRSLFQTMKDNFNSNTQGPKPGDGPVKSFVENVGAGGGDFVRAAAHPVRTISSQMRQGLEDVEAGNDPVGMQGARLIQSLIRNPGRTIGNLGTGAIVTGGAGLAADAAAEPVAAGLNATGRTAKSLGARVSGFTVGAPPPAEVLGADTGSALASNRVVAMTPRNLATKVRGRIGPAAEARGLILDRSTAGPTDVSADVRDPFDKIAAVKTDPVTGAARPASISKLTGTRRAITEVQDPDSGQPSGTAKVSDLFPGEMGRLQRNIYDMTDYTNPDSDLANQGAKGAAANLRTRINQVAPEATTATDNLHNLLGAEDHLKSITGAPPSSTDLGPGKIAGKLYDRVRVGGGTAAGAGLDLAGTGLMKAGGLVRQMANSPAAPPTTGVPPPPTPSPVAPAPRQLPAAVAPTNAQPFPSRVIPPPSPVAPAATMGTTRSVTAPPPPATPRGLLEQVAGPSAAPEPAPPRAPQPGLNPNTARTRIAPNPGNRAQGSLSRKLIVDEQGNATPETLQLTSPMSRITAEADRATGLRRPTAPPEVLPPVARPPATAPQPAPAKSLSSKVSAPAPAPARLPAPTDVDAWEALVDEGKARYNTRTHQYDYLPNPGQR